MLVWIFQTFLLPLIAFGRSSMLHPLSVQSCYVCGVGNSIEFRCKHKCVLSQKGLPVT